MDGVCCCWFVVGFDGLEKNEKKKVSLSSWFVELSCCTAVVRRKSFHLISCEYYIVYLYRMYGEISCFESSTTTQSIYQQQPKSLNLMIFPFWCIFLFVFPIIYNQLKSSQRRRLTHSSLRASWYFQIELDRHLTRAFTLSCAASGNNKRRNSKNKNSQNECAVGDASKWQKPVRRSLARRCRPRIISKP